jgi:hypothetical protein
VYEGSKWVVVGDDGHIVVSDDEDFSSQATENAAVADSGDLHAVRLLSADGFWYAAGENGRIMSTGSSNPRDAWSDLTTTGLGNCAMIKDLFSDGELYYAVGSTTDGRTTFWSSPDARAWTERPYDEQTSHEMVEAVFVGSQFKAFVVGDDSSLHSFFRREAYFKSSSWVGLTLEVGAKAGIVKLSNDRTK